MTAQGTGKKEFERAQGAIVLLHFQGGERSASRRGSAPLRHGEKAYTGQRSVPSFLLNGQHSAFQKPLVEVVDEILKLGSPADPTGLRRIPRCYRSPSLELQQFNLVSSFRRKFISFSQSEPNSA